MPEFSSHYEESLMLSGTCGAMLRLAQAYKPHPLPGDRPHYAPDKVATAQHIKLEITLDVPNKSVSGVCSTTLIPINDGLTSVEFDAVETSIESVTLDGGTPLPFELHDNRLRVRLPEPVTFQPAGSLTSRLARFVRCHLSLSTPQSCGPL